MNAHSIVVHPYLTGYQRDVLLRLVDQERERVLSWQEEGDPTIDILNRIEEELKQAK